MCTVRGHRGRDFGHHKYHGRGGGGERDGLGSVCLDLNGGLSSNEVINK